MTQQREYVLGTHDEELGRLGFQHRLWSDVASAHWRRAGFGPGKTILDVGCGPGFAARDISQLLGDGGGEGRVIGMDESERYVEFVLETGSPPGGAPIEAFVGDAQALDLDPASIDGAYARWVLSFVPEPERVVEGVARALRVGGTFAVQDYSHWMGMHWGPNNDTLAILRRAILASYESVRADSNVGSKIGEIMELAGFEVIEIRPLARAVRPTDPLWQWPRSYFRTFLPRVVEMGHLREDERLAIEAEWDELERTPGAFFYTPPQVEVIGVKR